MPEVCVTSLSRTRFDVWNEVPLVPQLTGMSCWAAAAAMIIGWRDMIVVDPEQVATGAGRWSEYREGLRPLDITDFAEAWGLHSENPVSWSVHELRTLLHRYGPLWLGEASPGLHSVVVTGMFGDGSPAGTWVRVNDPWPVNLGERYSLRWPELLANFRKAATIAGVHAQLMHAGGRRRSGADSARSRRDVQHVERRADGSLHAQLTHESSFESAVTPGPERTMHDTYEHEPNAYPVALGSPAAVATVVAPGRAFLDTSRITPNSLSGHGGTGENLCLVWNQLPEDLAAIDVVVHLHGYSSRPPDAAMLRAKAAAAGVDLAGRTRPTLGVIPRGRKITTQELRADPDANAERYTFPALVTGGGAGLERLIAYALDYLRRTVLRSAADVPLRVDRLVITAHSGGGAPLNTLLAAHQQRAVCNPHEVHVFDATYGSVAGIAAWARARIAADRQLSAAELPARGGGARIVYRRGRTEPRALELARALPAVGDPLHTAYRAERSAVGHHEMPRTLGGTLLADVRAELARTPPRALHVADDTAHAADSRSTFDDAAVSYDTADAYGAPIGLMEHYRVSPPPLTDRPPPWQDAGLSATALQAAPDWCQLRQTIAAAARTELARWTRPNGTSRTESEAAMLPILREYWGAVPNMSAAAVNNAAQQSARDNDDFAWSAAFICFVMRRARVGCEQGFQLGGRHLDYIVGALRNRERSDTRRPFWLLDHIEIQNETTPEPGDLICFNRQVRIRGALRWTTHSYQSLRTAFWSNCRETAQVSGSSHCALVVGTWQDPATRRRFVETIGGNEDESVRLRRNVPLSDSGGIQRPQDLRIFGMIKMNGCRR